jgi:DNA processing protein
MPSSETAAALQHWISVGLVPGIGPATYRALLSAFGLPGNILAASRSQLARVVSDDMAAAILANDRVEDIDRTLDWAAKPNHHILTLADATYPPQLLEIADPPPLLYVIGNVDLLSKPGLGVVGSRNASPQGEANAEQFSTAFSLAGLTIISGLALGIDAAAHRGGLSGPGSTIAVMGTGPDSLYPKRNLKLAAEIAERGALLTEFPLGTMPLSGNFPRRNRLISGLSRGVLVVEAALPSGSLITARQAADQGREVFAIPGSIHSPMSRGCHALIKQGAKLADSAQDVLEELGMTWVSNRSTPNKSGTENSLIQHMGYEAVDVTMLAARAHLTPEAVSAMLLQLELEGKVASLPGGRYQRLA